MPHTSSAEKALRQIAKRNARNRNVKKGIKVELKQFAAAVKGNDVDAMKAELKAASKKLDKAAARNVIHPNQAARKKSQLARALNAKLAKASQPAPAPAN